jgi:TetR/AcrR family transcriptional regulator
MAWSWIVARSNVRSSVPSFALTIPLAGGQTTLAQFIRMPRYFLDFREESFNVVVIARWLFISAALLLPAGSSPRYFPNWNFPNMSRERAIKRRTKSAVAKASAVSVVWNNVVPSRNMQRELKREAVLQAAVSAFNRKGFSKTSLDDIAQKLGVTKTALYYYFPTKNALLAACFDRAMQVASASLAAGKQEGRNGREKLILMLRHYLETMTGELSECLLLTEEHSFESNERRELIKERDNLERQLRDLVEQGISDGSIVPCNPKLTIFLMLGAVNWVPKWFSRNGPWTNVEVAKGISDMLNRMLSTAEGPKLLAEIGASSARR